MGIKSFNSQDFPNDRIKVTRVLVYEGNRKWIETVLSRCYIKPDEPFETVLNKISEISRTLKLLTEKEA